MIESLELMEWTEECFPFLSFISNQWLKKNLNRKIVFSSHFISSIFRSNILLFSSNFFLSCRCVHFVAVRLMINSISVRQPLRFIYHSRSMRVKHHLKPSLLNSFFYNFGHYASEKWNVLLVKWWRIHKVILMFNKTFCSFSLENRWNHCSFWRIGYILVSSFSTFQKEFQ